MAPRSLTTPGAAATRTPAGPFPLARPSLMVDDPDHSEHEERFVLFGRSVAGWLLAVMHTERDGAIRLISARHFP